MPRSNSLRATVFALATSALLVPAAHASPSDDTSRRDRVPNNVALSIAAELFPEQCGQRHCGITYAPEYCPFQFAIVFPRTAETPKEQPPGAWVTVNGHGKVVEVNSEPSKECRKGNGASS